MDLPGKDERFRRGGGSLDVDRWGVISGGTNNSTTSARSCHVNTPILVKKYAGQTLPASRHVPALDLPLVPLRIGLFGGTFDPPHVGHLVTAVNVRHALGLDAVVVLQHAAHKTKAGRAPLRGADALWDITRGKAAEDSRTPRRWRAILKAPSARFWSVPAP